MSLPPGSLNLEYALITGGIGDFPKQHQILIRYLLHRPGCSLQFSISIALQLGLVLKRSYLFFLVLGLWLVLSSCLPRTPGSSGLIETTPQVTPSMTLAREIISTPTPTQQKAVGSSPSPG